MTCDNFTTKRCSNPTCHEIKDVSEFASDSATKDGLNCYCKPCASIKKETYRKTKVGLIGVIHGSQRCSSKNRGHEMPPYSVDELREWVLAQPIFHKLYNKWVASGYDRWLKPSCDRTDDNLPYSLNRLEVKTWKENSLKWNNDVMTGESNKQCKSVVQMNIDGTFVKEWHSINNAHRNTTAHRTKITMCCQGQRKTAGGFRWMYSIGIPIYNNAR